MVQRPKGGMLALIPFLLYFSFPLAQASSSASSSSSYYTLIDTFNSSNFFSEFSFFDEPDPTHGFVEYVNASTANSLGLAGFSQGGIYLGVDHHNVTSSGRKSVRVTSNRSYTAGLFVADIAHMPSGSASSADGGNDGDDDGSCGLWPAYWMFGPRWPTSGEIDILEGVNSQRSNSITLHTASGCEMTNNTGSLPSTRLVTTNCGSVTGCGQQTFAGSELQDGPSGGSKEESQNTGRGGSSSNNNYGTGFNKIGGGYYIMEWTEQAISVWFLPRTTTTTTASGLEAISKLGGVDGEIGHGSTNRSSSLSSSSSDLASSLGAPLATFIGGDDCSIPDHFARHNIVFDTTFCGDWAGRAWKDDSKCSALAETCEEWVGQNPEKFAEGYWLINEIKVYQKRDHRGRNDTKRKNGRREVEFRG